MGAIGSVIVLLRVEKSSEITDPRRDCRQYGFRDKQRKRAELTQALIHSSREEIKSRWALCGVRAISCFI